MKTLRSKERGSHEPKGWGKQRSVTPLNDSLLIADILQLDSEQSTFQFFSIDEKIYILCMSIHILLTHFLLIFSLLTTIVLHMFYISLLRRDNFGPFISTETQDSL